MSGLVLRRVSGGRKAYRGGDRVSAYAAMILKGDPRGITLEKRMEELHVHGVSIAVIHDGKGRNGLAGLEWLATGGAKVTPETMFQAGSIRASRWRRWPL